MSVQAWPFGIVCTTITIGSFRLLEAQSTSPQPRYDNRRRHTQEAMSHLRSWPILKPISLAYTPQARYGDHFEPHPHILAPPHADHLQIIGALGLDHPLSILGKNVVRFPFQNISGLLRPSFDHLNDQVGIGLFSMESIPLYILPSRLICFTSSCTKLVSRVGGIVADPHSFTQQYFAPAGRTTAMDLEQHDPSLDMLNVG